MGGPEYDPIPSAFGGGIVAETPYRRHPTWTFPEEGGEVIIRETDPSSITDPPGCRNLFPIVRVRTYGPVYRSGSGVPLRVDRRTGFTMSNEPIWTDVTSDFTIDLTTTPGSATREIPIEKMSGAWTKGTYRVVYDRTLDEQSSGNGEATILCASVPGNPRMESFVHLFSTRDRCGEELLMMFDLTADDDLCMQDVAEWTANPVDFNGDGTTCSQDVAMLLQAIGNFHAN